MNILFIILLVCYFIKRMPKNKTILMIEDEEVISSMYETKLKQEGYDVLIANDGAEGLKLAQEKKCNIILLDVILPQIDGFSVLEEIRKKDKKTPVIMLTNLGTPEDKEKGDKFGATDYLVKASLTPAQISAKIKKYIK